MERDMTDQDPEIDDDADDDAQTPAVAATYFVMTCEGVHPATMVEEVSDWFGAPWMTGQIIRKTVPSPFIFRLVPEYEGELKAMYEGSILLMRDDLIRALQEAGVDNLQLFPAAIHDEVNAREHTDYKAVNIIGLVSCANMAQSPRMDPDDDSEIIDVDFDSLVIDESKTGGALLFRLAESASAIVVHRSVRERAERIPGMTFYGPGEWSG
jgi:hypothetical protein